MKNERKPYSVPKIDLLALADESVMLSTSSDPDEGMWQMLMNGVDFTQNA